MRRIRVHPFGSCGVTRSRTELAEGPSARPSFDLCLAKPLCRRCMTDYSLETNFLVASGEGWSNSCIRPLKSPKMQAERW